MRPGVRRRRRWARRAATRLRRSGVRYWRAATQPASASSATGASSPSARRRRALPPFAPSERTERRLFALTSRSPAPTAMLAWKPIAVRTNCAAGRACRSTPAGSETRRSELGDGTSLLRGRDDLVERAAGRRHHGGGDRALHERRVDEPHRSVAVDLLLEHGARGEDRAAQVAEHDRALALVGGLDGGAHERTVGAEPAVRAAAGGLDADLRSGHLRGERSGAGGDLATVRHDYDADHRASLNYRSRFDNAERK